MRPPEFTGGNATSSTLALPTNLCFNEAAGIHRRKRKKVVLLGKSFKAASMRPPEFTGGNLRCGTRHVNRRADASMRPPEFTGGNSPLQSR